MTYVISKTDLPTSEAIQELSFDEIAHVCCSAGRSFNLADVGTFTDWFLHDLTQFLGGFGEWSSVVNSWNQLLFVVNVVYP